MNRTWSLFAPHTLVIDQGELRVLIDKFNRSYPQIAEFVEAAKTQFAFDVWMAREEARLRGKELRTIVIDSIGRTQ